MAIDLNGSDQYLWTPDNAALTLADADWSIAGWFYRTSNAGSNSPFFVSWGTFSGAPSIGIWAPQASAGFDPNKLRSYILGNSGGTPNPSSGTGFGSLTGWIHVMEIHDNTGDTIKLYANGAEVASVAAGLSQIDVAGVLYLGAADGLRADRFCPYPMAEWAKWNSALDATARTKLAAFYYPTAIGVEPAWYLPLLDNSDEEIEGLTFTEEGSPGWTTHPPMTTGGEYDRLIRPLVQPLVQAL